MSEIYCQECTSTNISSDFQGYHVCRDCGLVVNQPVIQSHTNHILTNKNGDLTYQNAIIIDAGTTIGNNLERNQYPYFKHLYNAQKMVIKHPNTRAFSIFSQLKAIFEVSVATHHFFNDFSTFYPQMKMGSKSRNIPLLCSTLFYLKCKKQAIKIDLKDVISQYGFSKKDYFDCAQALYRISPNIAQISLSQLYKNVLIHIGRLQQELKLSDKIIRISKYLVKKYRPYLGEKSEIIAGSAIGIAIRIVNPKNKPSNFQISKILSVTASTIYGRVKTFKVEKLPKKIQLKLKEEKEISSENQNSTAKKRDLSLISIYS